MQIKVTSPSGWQKFKRLKTVGIYSETGTISD
jgi:hypothetical protein